MKIGERKNRFSRLEVDEALNLPAELAPHFRWIRDVETVEKHQRKGWATKLLKKVCEEADKAKLHLMLEPNGYGEMSDEDLMRWYYKQFGFITVQVKTKDLPCLMTRAPK